MKDNSQLKIASIHEAGHAIIYHLMGANIDYMYACENGEGMVRCCIYTPTSLYSECPNLNLGEKLDLYGMVCLGGYCAELKYLNKRLNGIMRITCTTDYWQAEDNDVERFCNEMKYANDMIGKQLYEDFFFYLVQTSTRKLIAKKKCWQAVLKLSEELMKADDHSLHGLSVHAILNEFIKHGSMNYMNGEDFEINPLKL